jgi:energy-coupling factor transport system ATP-binding protein
LNIIIHGSDICFSYDFGGQLFPALSDISVEIKKGELVAILGKNGSGKSTLAKHFNVLLAAQKGELSVAGINARDAANIWLIRRQCGMVFQNPDNQFVSAIVEEDVAFGLENYEMPEDIISEKVKAAIKLVGMQGYEKRAPHTLSGGQKQRIALAGVLALEPNIIIFDEATSMLDPDGRMEILDAITRLHKEEGKTCIIITHYVEETLNADRIFLMQQGKILKSGTPREILTDKPLMEAASMVCPMPVRLYFDLKEKGCHLNSCPLTNEELAEEICRLL